MDKRLSLMISGRVQGVSYRMETIKKARELKLTGFVKNTEDKRVRIIAEGKEKNLELLKDWAMAGSRNAKVEKVKFKYSDAIGEFDNFAVKK